MAVSSMVFGTWAILIMAISSTAAGAAPLSTGGGQFVTRELSTEHGVRRYKLFIPSSYDGSKALPLVVMLHGCTQDPDDIARGTRLNGAAEEKSVLVAYPEQPDSANPRKCWNWYDAAHQRRDAGEPALIAAITRQVIADYRVDVNRVYVAGISAGAAMAIAVGLSYPDLYAAVGSHSGIAYGAATSVTEALSAMQGQARDPIVLASNAKSAMGPRARAIPAIVFQGESDRVVNPANGAQLVAQLAAVRRTGAYNNGANITEKGETKDGYHYIRTRQDDSTIEFWLIQELGHAWSGGSTDGTFTDSRGPTATAEMFRFFLEHPRSAEETRK